MNTGVPTTTSTATTNLQYQWSGGTLTDLERLFCFHCLRGMERAPVRTPLRWAGAKQTLNRIMFKCGALALHKPEGVYYANGCGKRNGTHRRESGDRES